MGAAGSDRRFDSLELGGNKVVLDTEIGHLRRLEFASGGDTIAPLHTAPWVTDQPIDRANTTLAPTEQGLSGDFFCAPFGGGDIEPTPIHGWTANAPWRRIDGGETTAEKATASYDLSRPVMGAAVRKTLTFLAGQPFLYISHAFSGGRGRLPVSHHAMIHAETKARLSFSPKALFFTSGTAPEADPARGRSLLRYPAQGSDLGAVPLQSGVTVDIRTYPFAEGHEDIVSMMEVPGGMLGWSAAVREAENDIVLLLKDSRVLPSTMLWMSNGGRDYPPWSGRHRHVLGIEDGRTFGPAGHRGSIEPNELTALGYETALDLSCDPTVRYAIGAIRRPEGWTEVRDIRANGTGVTLTETGGDTLNLPFAVDWLLGAGSAG